MDVLFKIAEGWKNMGTVGWVTLIVAVIASCRAILWMKKFDLENENIKLKATGVEALMAENEELKRKIAEYEKVVCLNDSPLSSGEEI